MAVQLLVAKSLSISRSLPLFGMQLLCGLRTNQGILWSVYNVTLGVYNVTLGVYNVTLGVQGILYRFDTLSQVRFCPPYSRGEVWVPGDAWR
jgi:hypothetical protein